ncbi:MAG: DUF485 domain-containing protein [Epsilonproteobacteria bacterium]|nr:MAG: DUF485 domain-containing protein [Campylobacterota bacterium]
MTDILVEQIKNHPKYQELTAKRTRFAWALSIIMLFVYYTFIMSIAFFPEFLGTPMNEGSVISIGIPIGIVIILFSFFLTGLYVYKANGIYDVLLKEIKHDLKVEEN